MNRLLLLLLAITLAWGASSCNFYRRITGTKRPSADSTALVVKDTARAPGDTAAAASAIRADSAQQALLQRLLPLWNARTPWSTFSGNAKSHFEGKGEVPDFTAHIRMEKDKAIWISVTATFLNIEAARVLITPDTVQIQDKIQKESRVMSFREAGSLLPIPADFGALQSLIIGEAISAGHQPNVAKDTANALIAGFISPDLSLSMQFDKADSALHFQSIATPTSSVICEYSNWTRIGAHRFANTRNMVMTDKADTYILNLDFSKAVFDEAVEMPFSIPDNYKRN
jgi:hypothetical protein